MKLTKIIITETKPILEVFNMCNVVLEDDTQIRKETGIKVETPYGYENIIGFYFSEKLPIYKLVLKNGQSLKCAEKHIVKTANGWKKICELLDTDLICIKQERYSGIKKIEKLNIPEENLYDFEVENVHCYYSNNIVSHNSMLLAYLAAEAFKQGKNVIYYTFEMAEKLVGLRIDAKLTQIPLTSLLLDTKGTHREAITKKVKEIREKTNKSPRLVIKEFPTKTATITTIKSNLTSWYTKGFVPDLIILDYADLMRPSHRYTEHRFELESISEQLRGLAMELQIPVWTASQGNRSSLDENVVRLNKMAESLGKAMVADIVLSIGRDDNLVKQDKACYYLAKNRLGKANIAFTGKFDTSILDFTIDSEGMPKDTTDIKVDEQLKVAKAVRDLMGKDSR